MGQINIQFHAKRGETVNFIRNIVSQYNLKAFGINIFPDYEAKEIFLFNWEKNVNYDEIIVCKGFIEISNREQYNEYLNEKRGDLIISLGKDNETELIESGMGAISTDNINALWKKVIAQFKKELLKGAYVVTPNGNSSYYPKHWYTIGAKDAYEAGVIIKPLAGWNQYILKRACE